MSEGDTTTHVWERDPLKGQVIGEKYQVLDPLGRGGMGRVYVAMDLRLGRQVALKILSEDLAEQRTYLERFKREARAAAGIGHPNIVQVYDIDQTDEGIPYLAMELLRGHDLHAELDREAFLSVERAVDIAGQVLFALSAAHRAGIVHRDLKPENIFLTKRVVSSWRDFDESGTSVAAEVVKILDFGISRFLGSVPDSTKLTATGAVIGTPQYMAPEQIKPPHEVDGRADLYAVGIIMYLSLTGRTPYLGDNPFTILHHVLNRPTPNVREKRPEIPEGLAEVIERAMAKDPLHRFQTADEFITALRPYCFDGSSEMMPEQNGIPAADTIADDPRREDFTPTVYDEYSLSELPTELQTDREFPPRMPAPRPVAPPPTALPVNMPVWARGPWEATEEDAGPSFELASETTETSSGTESGVTGQRLVLIMAGLSVAALVLAGMVFLVVTLLIRGGEPSRLADDPPPAPTPEEPSRPTEPEASGPPVTPASAAGPPTEPGEGRPARPGAPATPAPQPAERPRSRAETGADPAADPAIEEPDEPPSSPTEGGREPPVARTPPPAKEPPRPPPRPRERPSGPDVPVAREAPW